jgi:ribosomal protein S18 acetylase RimI-like enzyme
MDVVLRPANSTDSPAIARACVLAGGGAFEFLFGGLRRGADAETILAHLCAGAETPYAYRHFTIAETGGAVVGAVNAMSLRELEEADSATMSALRDHCGVPLFGLARYTTRRVRLLLRMRGRHADPNTLLLPNVAVFPEFESRGIGTELVSHVLRHAVQDGYKSVSLVVWESNARARALYARLGFQEIYKAPFRKLGNMKTDARCLMVAEL